MSGIQGFADIPAAGIGSSGLAASAQGVVAGATGMPTAATDMLRRSIAHLGFAFFQPWSRLQSLRVKEGLIWVSPATTLPQVQACFLRPINGKIDG